MPSISLLGKTRPKPGSPIKRAWLLRCCEELKALPDGQRDPEQLAQLGYSAFEGAGCQGDSVLQVAVPVLRGCRRSLHNIGSMG